LRLGDHVTISNQISQQIGNIQNLQNYLTSSTLFLSNYTIKACQTTINELTAKLESSKTRLVTKKKFGFRSKSELPAVADLPESKTDGLNNGKSTTLTETNHINWTVENRTNEEVTLNGVAVHNQDITMANLNGCVIRIFGHPSSLQFSHLNNCVVLCGPVSRSVFADNCKQTKFSFGCQQLRLHSSTHCDIYIHVTSRAIIEDCTNIRVAPLSFRYETIDQDFIDSGLDVTRNNWNNIADFNWLSTSVKSPNWIPMNECDRVIDWQLFLNVFHQELSKPSN